MSVLTFRANSIQEALQLVRENLGPDASVVSTRQVRSGLFSKSVVEVHASRDLVIPSRFPQPLDSIALPSLEDPIQNDDDDYGVPSTDFLTNPLDSESSNLQADRDSSFHDLSTPAMAQVLSELKDVGVPAQLAGDLLLDACRQCSDAFLNDAWLIRGQIVEATARRLATAESRQTDGSDQKIVAFIGPPNSGKTTLLCKVANQATIENQLEIGMVVIDNWKSTATDSLLHLAERISAEVAAVSTAEQLAKAMQRLRECDLVFIDTPGCQPQDSGQMRKLHEILQIAQPEEIHLVLDADSELSASELAIDQFSQLGTIWLDISKLDCAQKCGKLLSKLFACQIPIVNLSHGAEVTSDLIQPNRRLAASVLLGQKRLRLALSE